MNAVVQTQVPRPKSPVVTSHSTHKFKLLLRREFWEHKGGFLWAPLIAGGISLLLTLMAVIVAEVAAGRALARGDLSLGGDVIVNGLDIGALTGKLDLEHMRQLAEGLDISLLLSSFWPFAALAFVVFFYCLGALYDDRKDRSVLFWKSLPLSDTQTVLSKVASATIIAPLLAIAMGLVTMLGFMVLVSALVLIHGGNPITLLWGPANPLSVAASLIATLPVYALWAMPTVGWLLLCSAWARTKPFLWALMVPVFAGIFVSWFDLMELFDLDSSWFWSHIVGRMLLGTVPTVDLLYRNDGIDVSGSGGGQAILEAFSAQNVLASLTMPGLWIGVVVGAAMIFAAIRLRRWRDEG